MYLFIMLLQLPSVQKVAFKLLFLFNNKLFIMYNVHVLLSYLLNSTY